MTEPWTSLAKQSRGRALSAAEMALASGLEAIFSQGVTDFDEVARRLTSAGISAPSTRSTSWTRALLLEELTLINRSLDEAYARGQSGA